LKSTDENTAISIDVIRKMIEIGNRENFQTFDSKDNVSGPLYLGSHDGQNEEPRIIEKAEEIRQIPLFHGSGKNHPTISESDASSTYYREYGERLRRAGTSTGRSISIRILT
jgi:hypothetical protein